MALGVCLENEKLVTQGITRNVGQQKDARRRSLNGRTASTGFCLRKGSLVSKNAGLGLPFSHCTMPKVLTPNSGIDGELTCSHENRPSANREGQRQQAAERAMSSTVLSEPHLTWLRPFHSRRLEVASWRHIRSDGADLTQ
jgi:hypothetical protein